MKDQIDKIINEAEQFAITTIDQLESYKIRFLVKKGLVNQLFIDFKDLASEEKKILGKELNVLKSRVEELYNNAEVELRSAQSVNKKTNPLPGYYSELGSRHPISAIIDEMTSIFERLGFSISTGPEIEDDWHNFSALNFPYNHPARDMQDTFFVDDEIALRTHTSSVQVRLMEEGNLPIRSIMPGRVYRNEAISARSNCFFHQVEGLYIDKGVSFSDLKQTLYNFVQEFFGTNTRVRFRASYFPFTEPSAEMDVYWEEAKKL